ncbi:Proteasome lid subunit RPN8/RPN11, contains Jab1/MPN metalloenzyme (JAMM) motif [Paenibacillus sp. yr247]|uniref:M67 family metallopeptidase n=1 Tax=Paenibacillus sp. yr247 TaxID=1761880 RepID=UPI00088CF77A|nr:M67 family metallopeptidase [Paenibacillus sp. yr247]SDO27446.1 Proteasome lid subunit RPN8/RPN11, contains Jab1/MPN metalloenzyme (JAMM) motif [Paenibacillus sp. yr247]
MIVHLNEELYINLVLHSLQKLPEEACGFILGGQSPEKHGILQARSFVPLRNCAKNPRIHFELDPEEMIPFLMDSINPVIGLFHTHPTAPPVPSNMDLQTLWHSIPTYWILSLQHPEQPELQLYQIKKATPTSYHKLAFVIGQ